jgi:hypothetical protein
MNMADKLVAIADIVGLVVFGVSKNGQDAVAAEVVHLMPEHRREEQTAHPWLEQDGLFPPSVKELHPDGSNDAEAKLA